MKISVLFFTMTIGMVFQLSAEKVSIQGKRLTMTELLYEAASQVNREVRLEFNDPAPVKNFYDCEIEFEAVVSAVKGYFLEKINIELESILKDGVLILKPKYEAVKYQAPVKVDELPQETPHEVKKSKGRWKGLFGNLFSKKGKSKPEVKEEMESTSIKRMVYPDDKEVADLEDSIEKPDYDQTWTIPSKIKVEVLPSKRSIPGYMNKESVDETGLIKLKPMVKKEPVDKRVPVKKAQKPIAKKQVEMELDDFFIESEQPAKKKVIQEKKNLESTDKINEPKLSPQKTLSGNVKEKLQEKKVTPKKKIADPSKVKKIVEKVEELPLKASVEKDKKKKSPIQKENKDKAEKNDVKKPIQDKKVIIKEELPKVEGGVNKATNVDINDDKKKPDDKKATEEALDFPDL